MRNRPTFALTFLLTVALLLAACAPAAPGGTAASGDAAASDDAAAQGTFSGELVMWRFPLADDQEKEEAAWNTIIERFNEKYPDVTITIETQPWDDRTQKLLSAIGSGRGPDVFYINPDMIPSFAQTGAIVPIDDFITPEDIEKFNEGTVIEWDGKHWGLPILQNAPIFIWNTTLAESIGLDTSALPETMDDFEVWARTAKENGLYVSTWRAGSATAGLTEMIWKFGGEIFDEQGNVVVDNPGTVAALDYIKLMYDEGWIPPDAITASGDDDVALFRQQKTLAIRTDGNRFYGSQESFVDNFEWAFGPVLAADETVTNGTVGTYTITSNAENPTLAAEWIKHVTDTENSSLLNQTTGYLPPLKEPGEFFASDEGYLQLLELATYVHVDPVYPAARQAYFILAEEHQAVLTGQKTSQEAAAAMQERIQKAADELAAQQ